LSATGLRAAQYVRASTEYQKYSTSNQAQVIGRYAETHGLEVVRTYADDGRSGLDLQGRPGLRQLLGDVLRAEAPFEVLLVYDVSRWGRFQDADESAYYEHICKRAGVHVVYCAEPFENDGSAIAGVMKAMKRAMAGEYSRELSVRVSLAKRRLAELGFHQGAWPGLGLRRLLIDAEGRPKGVLKDGDRKSLANDRVILTAGPPEEVALVQRIFRLYADDRLSDCQITHLLNGEGVPSPRGLRWRSRSVLVMLTNERYIGNNVFNKSSRRLKQKSVNHPPAQWTRCVGAWPGIIEVDLFEKARAVRLERAYRLTDEDFLKPLKTLLDREGRLSAKLIDAQSDMFPSRSYKWRFDGLINAYRQIGYYSARDYSRNFDRDRKRGRDAEHLLSLLRGLYEREGYLTRGLIDGDPGVPSARVYQWKFGGLHKAYARIGYAPPKTRRRGRVGQAYSPI
jgi:DNA invertase Pin-like site-specific DNA recombinase